MRYRDISSVEAELLSILLEGLLYGASLLMFGGTIWALSYQRSTHQVNVKMITVASLLLLFSTVHFVIHIISIVLTIFSQHTPGGDGYFSSGPHWTFIAKNYLYTAQTLIGDGVVLYRCYVIWQSKLVMILPVLLWCAVVVTGIGSLYSESQLNQDAVDIGPLSRWTTPFWASTLTTNLLSTLILAVRIWYVHRHGPQKFQLWPLLHIIVDAGVIYSLTLLTALVCFVYQTNFEHVLVDLITPIISITFYMVIIRVGMANRSNQQSNTAPHACTSSVNGLSGERMNRMQVHVTTLAESKIESGRCIQDDLAVVTTTEKNYRSEFKLDEVPEEV